MPLTFWRDDTLKKVPTGWTARQSGAESGGWQVTDNLNARYVANTLRPYYLGGIFLNALDNTADADVVMECDMESAASLGPILRYNGAASFFSAASYYWVYARPGIAPQLQRSLNGSRAVLATATGFTCPAVGVRFFIRYRLIGSSHQIRFWTGTVSDEPDTWNIDLTDSSLTAAGYNGFGQVLPSSTNHGSKVHRFGYATGGGVAPVTTAASLLDHPTLYDVAEAFEFEGDWTDSTGGAALSEDPAGSFSAAVFTPTGTEWGQKAGNFNSHHVGTLRGQDADWTAEFVSMRTVTNTWYQASIGNTVYVDIVNNNVTLVDKDFSTRVSSISTAAPDGTPLHVVVRHVAATGVVTLSVNGRTAGSNSFPATYPPAARSYIEANGTAVHHAAARFWDRVLTDQEIEDLYNGRQGLKYAGAAQEGILQHPTLSDVQHAWEFEGDLTDSVGSENLTASGTPVFGAVTPKYGQSVLAGDRLQTVTNYGGSGTPGSLELTFNYETAPTARQYLAEIGYTCGCEITSAGLLFHNDGNSTEGTGYALTPGGNYHVLLSWDGSAESRMYVNGVLHNTKAGPSIFSTDLSVYAKSHVGIGLARYWPRALTAAEVADLYSDGAGMVLTTSVSNYRLRQSGVWVTVTPKTRIGGVWVDRKTRIGGTWL